MTTPRRPMMFTLPLAGWKEAVSFPRLKLGPLVAKLDTGARTAALHVDAVGIAGRRVRFMIGRKRFAAPLVGYKRVKSSNGVSQLRPVIRATLQLGMHTIRTEITLANRSDMDVPMLLGRATVKGLCLVHPGKTFLLTRKPAKP
jgi:hypothetical protein